jgi:hypothetical protein
MNFHTTDFESSGLDIFVFGSNLAGRHGRGAAKDALSHGAKYGCGVGLSGDSYAIPTKDYRIQTLPLNSIRTYIEDFIEFSTQFHSTFYVTRVGCGLAGYVDSDIAPMFKNAPNNVYLPPEWKGILSE